MYFISENFFFNDISNKTFGVELVSLDDDSVINQFGMTYTEKLNMQDSPASNPFYSSEGAKDVDEIKLCFALVNLNGEPTEWDSMKIEEVYDWLITDDFVPFVSEDDLDKIYYFKTVGIVKQFSHDMKGYLEVTFQPYSNYTYNRIVLSGDNTITINNISNVDLVYKPVMNIEGMGNDVSISNTSLSDAEPFIIKGLSGQAIVDNLYRTVQTEDGKNLLPTCNRKWLTLKRGINKISIVGGKVTLICEFPVIS